MLRTATATALLTALVAVAGCGGGSDDSGSTAAPVSASPKSGSDALVSADATAGLVGPSERANKNSSSFSDKSGEISRKASGKTKAQKNGVAAGADCANGDMTPTPDNLGEANASILCLVNAERANAGLPALANNPQLQKAAEGMAARMVAEQFFSHETPDGKTVVDRIEPTGYIPSGDDWVVGENLAWGSGGLSTPQAIVNGWMNSPGHKANMLAADYKDIGLAGAMGSPSPAHQGGTVYVNNFGARAGANSNVTLPGSEQASNDTSAAAASKKATARKKAKKKRKKRNRRRRG